MFKLGFVSNVQLQELKRVEALVRDRFALDAQDLILVSELRARQEGFPELHTQILFWQGDGTRYRCVIFLPVSQVGVEDLPLAWAKGAFKDTGQSDCC